MKKPFNTHPFNDGRKYKPFRFSPATIVNLEIEAKTNTTHIRTGEQMPRDIRAGELLIEAAARKCDIANGEYAYDSALIRKLRAMDKNELLLALHGYFDGDLVTLDEK